MANAYPDHINHVAEWLKTHHDTQKKELHAKHGTGHHHHHHELARHLEHHLKHHGFVIVVAGGHTHGGGEVKGQEHA